MLGTFNNFPISIHRRVQLQNQNSKKGLQKAILSRLFLLNNKIFDLSSLSPYLIMRCEVGFEFGIANGTEFVFLDKNELNLCLKKIDENDLEFLDFFSAIRYHLIKKAGKKVPLRFDYQVIRFKYQLDCLEIQIRHERGTQHITLDDLTDFLIKQINSELLQTDLQPLLFENFKSNL